MKLAGWVVASLVCAVPSGGATKPMRAGVSRIDITPDGPIWMSGYGSRNHPSTGVVQHLYAKALAIEDGKGGRAVILTSDLIGLPRSITETAAARLVKQFGIDRSRLLFNTSHTHTGPLVAGNLPAMFELSGEDAAAVSAYGRRLADALVEVATAAIGSLAPATIEYGFGEESFAANRRQKTAKGVIIGVDPNGPVDHRVPVIRVRGPDGALKVVLFGYACHNTTLGGDFYEISGDYAGFAQAALEREHAGATAMFVMLCGGDQNPQPRGTLALAREHGESLAAEVNRVMGGGMRPVTGPVRAAFQVTELAFATHTREQFETESQSKDGAGARRARAMLKDYDERRPVRRTPYPVQAIRFGSGPVILALGGEVVVDYALRVKREFGPDVIVAGYSNDVMCYIPSGRMLGEGGYEVVDSMKYYGQPGPFAEDVEDRIFATIGKVMKRVR